MSAGTSPEGACPIRRPWTLLARLIGRAEPPPPFVPLFPNRPPAPTHPVAPRIVAEEVHRPTPLVAPDAGERRFAEPAAAPAQASPEVGHSVPKIIYSLWLQGQQQAPDIVRLSFRRWTCLNPDYTLRVLDGAAVDRLLAGFALRPDQLPVQALSDVVRARLLLDGGIWADASVFPTKPLDTWLPDLVHGSGFFAFEKPGGGRPVSSWFLAASPGHVLMRKWWAEVDRYWSKPRTLANLDGGETPSDPARQVAPDGGGATDLFPYFWFHHLFRYLLESDADFASRWDKCAKVSAGPPHSLQFLCAKGQPPPEAILRAASSAPVHKLNWRSQYPLALLETL